MSYKGKINVYTCSAGHQTVTIDTDEGVTPFMLRCRQKADDGKHNCTEMAQSCFYRCDQNLPPEYEWYKPASFKGYKGDLLEHLKKGGLEFRKLASQH